MSSFPRRSARLSPNRQDSSHERSLSSGSVPSIPISQTSSTSTTSHPSPLNQTNNPPPPPPTPQQPSSLKAPSFMPQQSHLHVPLPSPSANDINPFVGRPQSQPNPFVQQNSYSHTQPEQSFQQQSQQQSLQLHPHTNSISQPHPRDIPNMAAGQLQGDFLAEAAKRAQVACLMRDLEAMDVS